MADRDRLGTILQSAAPHVICPAGSSGVSARKERACSGSSSGPHMKQYSKTSTLWKWDCCNTECAHSKLSMQYVDLELSEALDTSFVVKNTWFKADDSARVHRRGMVASSARGFVARTTTPSPPLPLSCGLYMTFLSDHAPPELCSNRLPSAMTTDKRSGRVASKSPRTPTTVSSCVTVRDSEVSDQYWRTPFRSFVRPLF